VGFSIVNPMQKVEGRLLYFYILFFTNNYTWKNVSVEGSSPEGYRGRKPVGG